MRRFAAVGLAAVLVMGCAAEEPLVPPTPLTSIAAQRQIVADWQVDVGQSDKRGVARFTPLIVNDTVYVASVDGVVTALNVANGKRLWRRELEVPLLSGVGGDDNLLYVADRDGGLYALGQADGATRWQYTMSSEILVPVTAGFGVVIARSADGRVTGLNASDGSERWSNTYTPPALTVHGYSRPAMVPNGVLIGLDDGRLLALSLDAGKTVWESVLAYPSGRSEVERLVDIDADIVLDQQYVYAVSYQGSLSRIEPGRGRQTWTIDLSSTAGFNQADNVLYVTDDTDRVVAVDKNSGEVVWEQTALRGRRLTRPEVINGALVVGDYQGYLHLLSRDDGRLIGRTRAGDEPISQSPVILGNQLFVQTRDGSLRRFTVR